MSPVAVFSAPLLREVDGWRRRRREDQDATAAAQVRREREREEAEQVQRRRMDPAEVARATARFTGALEPARDDERLRGAGRRREADAARTEQDAIEMNRKINALFVEFNRSAGRPPTADEAEKIRRRVRGEGEAT